MARFLSTNQNSLLRIATSEIGVGGKRGAGVPGYGVRGTESRGTGSRGVENTGCGKHGVWWKTWGLVENTGSGGNHGVSVENTGSKCKTQGNHYFTQQ